MYTPTMTETMSNVIFDLSDLDLGCRDVKAICNTLSSGGAFVRSFIKVSSSNKEVKAWTRNPNRYTICPAFSIRGPTNYNEKIMFLHVNFKITIALKFRTTFSDKLILGLFIMPTFLGVLFGNYLSVTCLKCIQDTVNTKEDLGRVKVHNSLIQVHDFPLTYVSPCSTIIPKLIIIKVTFTTYQHRINMLKYIKYNSSVTQSCFPVIRPRQRKPCNLTFLIFFQGPCLC